MNFEPVYLDYNATTPLDHEVREAMMPILQGKYFGNPSSGHKHGREAKLQVENARKQVASLLNCDPTEITFTSGGTESNNTVLRCFDCKRLIISAIEHPAISKVADFLSSEQAVEVIIIPVDEAGIIKLNELEKALSKEKPSSGITLISIMHANNETGSIQPIPQVVQMAKSYQQKVGGVILVHTDAAQSAGKISVDVKSLGVDFLSLAGHKLYAPKGIGALFMKKGISMKGKLMIGADHECNKRAGTENVLEIVGLGKACEVALRDLEANSIKMKTMRDKLHQSIISGISPNNFKFNGHLTERLPNTLSISFKGIHAAVLLSDINEFVSASAGAACHSSTNCSENGGDIVVSATLKAMHVPIEFAMGTIRFSVGKFTTEEEIEKASKSIIASVLKLQKH